MVKQEAVDASPEAASGRSIERPSETRASRRGFFQVTHGPIVEALFERGFNVYSINPKQLDRFRDRFTVSGAKGDSLDADVLSHSLRTDTPLFRKLIVSEPLIVELREWSRFDEELKGERANGADMLKRIARDQERRR